MSKKILAGCHFLLFASFVFLPPLASAEDDKVVLEAKWAVRTLYNFAPDLPIKLMEKKDSPIPGFYAVKLLVPMQDQEVPFIAYVDRDAETVILGAVFVGRENVTKKEIGKPQARKIDMKDLDIAKSPARGPAQAKITIVDFSNFQCGHCVESWNNLRGILAKHPQDIRYVYKIFPFAKDKYSMEIAEAVAAVEVVNIEAFWPVHDYLFSEVGQVLIKDTKGELQNRIEGILKDKGVSVEDYRKALDSGEGKRKLQGDIILAQRLYVTQTPTLIVNGEFLPELITEEYIEEILGGEN